MANLDSLLLEAIRLELLVGELYLLFHRQHPEDERFWWELALEEENHAALLKTVRQMSDVQVSIPSDLLPENLKLLKESCAMVQAYITSFQKTPDRDRSFQTALSIENSAGELHYNSFMKEAPDLEVSKVFKKLNGSDLDHAERIREYMKKNQIPLG